MKHAETHKLADNIAKILEAGSRSNEFASLYASVEKLNHRLEKLEQAWASPRSAVHASHDRFAVAEAVADEVFPSYRNEKACTFEPNGKPCDHCSMCSSRGF